VARSRSTFCSSRNAAVALVAIFHAALCPVAGAQAASAHFSVPANVEWADTQIFLLPGDVISVVPTGGPGWLNVGQGDLQGPNGYGNPDSAWKMPDARLAALIQRIGDQAPTLATRAQRSVSAAGTLQLAMNDAPGTYGDNAGSQDVIIRYLLNPLPLPDFKFQTEGSAVEWLARYGFTPVIARGFVDDVGRGLVSGQDQAPGVDLHDFRTITLTVSDGPMPPAIVPGVVGFDPSEAEEAIRNAGLAPEDAGKESASSGAGLVARTDPIADARVKQGTTVRYWIGQVIDVRPPSDDRVPKPPIPISEPPWPWILGGGLLLAGVAALFLTRTPRKPPREARPDRMPPDVLFEPGFDPVSETRFGGQPRRTAPDVELSIEYQDGEPNFSGEVPVTGIEVAND
jgi:hypothetical protein